LPVVFDFAQDDKAATRRKRHRGRLPDAGMTPELGLFTAGFLSWAISTLSAGGGSFLLLAAASQLLGGQAVAPIVSMASLMANPARMITLWPHIRWRLTAWYVPGAAAGAVLGGWLLTIMPPEWLEICLAAFLISTVWQYRMGTRSVSFPMSLPWFVPVSLCSGTISGVVGASGLLANPFYLNYGLIKEEMLATRAVNSLAIQLVKLAAYGAFGVLNAPVLRYGVAAGMGAVLAICVANRWLAFLSTRRFRQLAVAAMALAGLLIFWRRRAFLARFVPDVFG
jgi:uncharacterized membrane protein YfcA